MLFGNKCNDKEEKYIAQDAKFIDFFDNTHIALYWLSAEGIILLANKTEMYVLGYTKEEYSRHPIMKLCPNEEEIVLEICKTLRTGYAIKDVSVIFGTKSGKLVHLIMDRNIHCTKGVILVMLGALSETTQLERSKRPTPNSYWKG